MFQRISLGLVVFVLALFSSRALNAQSDAVSSLIEQYAPTPHSQEVIRRGELGVNQNTGAVHMEIPVGTYSDQDFTIPVTLCYTYDGFKPASPSGEAGLGWSLMAGGSITREIVGVDDFGDRGYSGIGGNGPSSDAIYYLTPTIYTVNDYPSFDEQRETTSDIYHFSFPGHSGSFLIDNDGHFSTFSTSGERGTYDISVTANDPVFTITTSDGYTWRFGVEASSREIMHRQNGIQESHAHQLSVGEMPIVTWFLDKVTAPNGRSLEFTYTYSSFNNSIPSENDDVITSFGRGINKVGSNTKYKFASLVRTSYLTGITVRDSSDITRQVASFTWERKSYREVIEDQTFFDYKKMVSKTRCLKEISLYEGVDTVRTASLTYDDTHLRPLLTSVTIPVYGTWRFEYNRPSLYFPDMVSNAVDMWGYYNGKSSNGDSMIAPTRVRSETLDEEMNSIDMNPDASYSVVGALNKVTWPTGGNSVITYESHAASRMLLRLSNPTAHPIIDRGRSTASFTTSLENVSRMLSDTLCGGVRVKKIEEDNVVDGVSTRRYEYTNEAGQSSGIIQEFNRYYAGKVGVHDVMNPFLKYPGSSFDKNHIAYTSVVEVLPDSSSVRTDYTSWEDEPDSFSPYSYQHTMQSLGYGDQYDLFMKNILRESDSRAYRRGLPKKVSVRDSLGRLVKEELFKYTENGNGYAAYILGSGQYRWSARRFLCDYTVSSTVRTFHPSSGASLSSTDSLTYDPYGRLATKMTMDSDGSVRVTDYKYLSGVLRPSLIVSEVNRYSPAHTTSLSRTDSTAYTYSNASGIWNLTSHTRTLYSAAGYGAVSDSVQFSCLDRWGRPRELTVNGDVSSVLWGWRGRYPVAVIKNSPFSALPPSVRTAIPGNLSDNQIKSLYELAGAETRVFRWRPSVGITRIIAPSGRSVDYEYDSLMRLSSVKDAAGTTMECYSYGNQYYAAGDSLRFVQTSVNTGSAMRDELSVYDGMGRGWIDKVASSGDVNDKDLIYVSKYDGLGRKTHTYLPYAALSHILPLTYRGQTDYWDSHYGPTEGSHANVLYEYSSGLGAMLSRETNAGKAIRDAGKSTVYARSVNATGEVPYVCYTGQNGAVSVSGFYPSGTLLRTQITGPDGEVQVAFETMLGRKVLDRRVSGDTLLDTYYVHDFHDRLSWVITPALGQQVRSAAELPGGLTLYRSGTVAAESCYVYEYDTKGNLRRVRTPGAGYDGKYYNASHRMTLDFPATSLQTGGLLYTKHSYDGVGRKSAVELYRSSTPPIVDTLETPIFRDAHSSRSVPQDVLIDTLSFYIYGQSTSVDCITNDLPGTPYSAIPSGLAFSPRTGITVTPDVHVTGELILESHKPIVEPMKPFEHIAGELGWNYGDTMLGGTPVKTAYYYDARGQVTQSVRSWHDGGLSRMSYSYDLEGRVLSSLEEHTPPGPLSTTDWVWMENSYDTRGNLLLQHLWAGRGISPDKSDAKLLLTYSYTYDDIGRLAAKCISCGDRTLTESVSTTMQGWTSGLAYSLSGVNVFSESIRYWDPVKQPSGNRYGGMIAEATFHHSGYDTRTESYSYDGFERITGTASYIGSETSPGTVNVENGISYDAMGNVTSLNRHGPSGAATAQLTMSYSGNHCTQVYDSVSDQSWTNTYREDGTLLSDPRTGFKYADNLLGQVSQVAVIPLLPGPGNLVLVNAQSSYLPDGTKIESGSFSQKLYREGFIYAKPFIGNATLESVLLPGVVVSVADTVWRPLAWITDHLGSVRALADMKAGTVVERNDYHTYGTRITKPTSTASTYPSLFANRWRYAGKEEQSGVNDLALDDFGARLFDPFTANWIAPDPLAGNTPWISPYAYCAGNPVNLVDVDGRFPETIWDVANIALDVTNIMNSIHNGNNRDILIDIGGLVLDIAAAVIPFVPGGAGTAIKAARAADKSLEATRDIEKAVDAATIINKVDDAADVSKFAHGNSRVSTKAQHAYDIVDKQAGEPVKTGVSGGRIRKDGKSYRAESQVRQWNKDAGYDRYESTITHIEPEGKNARGRIYEYEKNRANELRKKGLLTNKRYHKKP